MNQTRQIHCCGCGDTVSARLTNGAEIYPHREDLAELPFWACDACGNFVGTHHRDMRPGQDRLRPLGVIPTPEIKRARQRLHRLIDPLWKSRRFKRADLYAEISRKLGAPYHTADLRSVEEAERVMAIVKEIAA